MSRAAALTGMLMLLFGGAVFAWKALVLDMPVVPSDPGDLWRVELEVDARGDRGRGSVRAALPSTGPGQRVFDEHQASDRLLFTIRRSGADRTGVWSGEIGGVHRLVHGARVQLSSSGESRMPASEGPPPREVVEAYGGATTELPADAPEIASVLATLQLPDPSDPLGRIRTLFAFVTEEIETVERGADDAIITLVARDGSLEGKARLLVALLRAAGHPARLASGLQLGGGAPRRRVWVEAWVSEDPMPMFPDEGLFGRQPAHLLKLRTGGIELVEATGVEAYGYRFRALREQLPPDELAAFMVPANPILSALSLYRLPVEAQGLLRLLLLLPLGAVVVAIFRNLIGVTTFGTFLPILLPLAMRQTGLGVGLALAGGILAIGVAGRLLLDRLRLLLVPRLCVLLCLVVLALTGASLVGRSYARADLFGGLLFPIVILTILIERFSITVAEEGPRHALVRLGSTALVAVCTYPLFRWRWAEHLMFGFPELVIASMGLLVWIGGYMGYRASDLIRFRALAQPQASPS